MSRDERNEMASTCGCRGEPIGIVYAGWLIHLQVDHAVYNLAALARLRTGKGKAESVCTTLSSSWSMIIPGVSETALSRFMQVTSL